MNITKKCTPPSERLWKGTCRACHSEAEALESEMTAIQADPREGGSFSWEICPVCFDGPFGGMLFYPAKTSA